MSEIQIQQIITDDTGQGIVQAIEDLADAIKPTAANIPMSSSDSTTVGSVINGNSDAIANLDGSKWISVTDYNLLTTSGVYQARGSLNTLNPPYPTSPGRYFMLAVWHNGNFVTQLAISPSYNQTFVRGYDTNTWTSWHELAATSNLGGSGNTITATSTANFKTAMLSFVQNNVQNDSIAVATLRFTGTIDEPFVVGTWGAVIQKSTNYYFSAICESNTRQPVHITYNNGTWKFNNYSLIYLSYERKDFASNKEFINYCRTNATLYAKMYCIKAKINSGGFFGTSEFIALVNMSSANYGSISCFSDNYSEGGGFVNICVAGASTAKLSKPTVTTTDISLS